jgi:pimeloyl-ACP methyl ester carboxylesterase
MQGSDRTMSCFVLVHGAWGTIRGYDKTAAALRAAGHIVHCVELKGLGTRAAELAADITLSDHVNDVLAVMDDNGLSDIILVGHSYGGMIITGAATQRADRIRCLVYVDAFLPENGEALWDIATDFERKHYIDAQRTSPGLVGPLPFPGLDPALRQPLLTLIEPVPLTGAEQMIARRIYIYATRGAPATFKKFYDRVSGDPAWQSHQVESGHMVMADAADALMTILLTEGT